MADVDDEEVAPPIDYDQALELAATSPANGHLGTYCPQTNDELDLPRKLVFRPSACLWDEQYNEQRQMTSQANHGS